MALSPQQMAALQAIQEQSVRDYITSGGVLDPNNLPPDWFRQYLTDRHMGYNARVQSILNRHRRLQNYLATGGTVPPLSQQSLEILLPQAPTPAVAPAQTRPSWAYPVFWAIGALATVLLVVLSAWALFLWLNSPKTGVADGAGPTPTPSAVITSAPTAAPTVAPTNAPTQAPTAAPTMGPTTAPTSMPTQAPTAPSTTTPTETMPPPGDVAACPSDAVILSQQLFGYDAALLRENNAPAEYCLFETNQSLPGQNTYTLASCPDGYTCEMDTVGPGGKLAYGPQDGPFVFEHASLRLVAAYPSWDPIHFPCTELGNSQSFVNDTAASSGWKVEPVGFTCEDELQPGTPPSSWTVNTCPPDGSAAEVAATIGGLPGEWTIGSDANGTYWKRAANSPRATLMAPWGKLDVWNGQPPTLHFGPGEPSSKSYEATWHCSQ